MNVLRKTFEIKHLDINDLSENFMSLAYAFVPMGYDTPCDESIRTRGQFLFS